MQRQGLVVALLRPHASVTYPSHTLTHRRRVHPWPPPQLQAQPTTCKAKQSNLTPPTKKHSHACTALSRLIYPNRQVRVPATAHLPFLCGRHSVAQLLAELIFMYRYIIAVLHTCRSRRNTATGLHNEPRLPLCSGRCHQLSECILHERIVGSQRCKLACLCCNCAL